MIRKKLIWLPLILGLAAADLLIKQLATHFLKKNSVTIIKDWLYLDYVENKGAIFGMFSGNRIMLIIFSLLAMCVCVWMLLKDFLLYKKDGIPEKSFRNSLITTGLCFVLGGSIGNVYQRITLGYVVDYIHFLRPVDFAVFNLADMCVVAATVMLFVGIIFLDRKPNE